MSVIYSGKTLTWQHSEYWSIYLDISSCASTTQSSYFGRVFHREKQIFLMPVSHSAKNIPKPRCADKNALGENIWLRSINVYPVFIGQ